MLGDVEVFTARLIDTLERYRLDEVTLSKIVAYKSLALWNAGIVLKRRSIQSVKISPIYRFGDCFLESSLGLVGRTPAAQAN